MTEFYKTKLKNGLTILFEKRSLPVVSVACAIKYGSAYETQDIKGISHFIEHLMFKGTKKRTAEGIAREIEKKGGLLNAFTSEEHTAYWNKLPSKHLISGIDISSDLILNPKFDTVEFEKERKVILEEIKMYHDTPQIYVLKKIKELLYKKPFGMFTAGNEETMGKIKRQDIIELFNKVYTTDSMILCVVGKADFQEIQEIAEKIFPGSKRKQQEHKPFKINKEIVEKRKGIDQTNFVLGFHVPTLKDKERYAFEIFDVILAQGMSSRLFKEIREKRGLCYAIKSFPEIGKEYGYETVYVGTVKEKIKQIKEIIIKEIKKFSELDNKELDETKEQLIGLRKVESEESVNVMIELLQEEIAGDAEEYYKYDEKIGQVKLDDVRKFSKLKSYSSAALVPE